MRISSITSYNQNLNAKKSNPANNTSFGAIKKVRVPKALQEIDKIISPKAEFAEIENIILAYNEGKIPFKYAFAQAQKIIQGYINRLGEKLTTSKPTLTSHGELVTNLKGGKKIVEKLTYRPYSQELIKQEKYLANFDNTPIAHITNTEEMTTFSLKSLDKRYKIKGTIKPFEGKSIIKTVKLQNNGKIKEKTAKFVIE